MTARLLAFALWAAVAATAVFWGLRLAVRAPAAPPHAVAAAGPAAAGDWSAVFGTAAVATDGAAPAPPPEAERFKLLGVVAPRTGGRGGVALLAVDDKPPRAVRAGAQVDGEWVLQEVRPRGISLGPRGGDAAVQLELPPLPPPATGSLPPAGAGPAATAGPRPSPIAPAPGGARPPPVATPAAVVPGMVQPVVPGPSTPGAGLPQNLPQGELTR